MTKLCLESLHPRKKENQADTMASCLAPDTRQPASLELGDPWAGGSDLCGQSPSEMDPQIVLWSMRLLQPRLWEAR